MKILLDTQVWLWMLVQPERLRASAREAVEDGANDLLLSAASSWEISIKYSLGKLPLPEPPATFVPARLKASGVTPLAIEHLHALRVADLPPHHRDPFDRLLIAQAMDLGVPVLTADETFDRYEIEVMAAS